jgi:hypothetical protein
MDKFEEKMQKLTKFKANFRLDIVNISAQLIPIYKAKTFICKNMCNIIGKMLTNYS